MPLGFGQDAHVVRQLPGDAAEAEQGRIADLPLDIQGLVGRLDWLLQLGFFQRVHARSSARQGQTP